MDETRENEPMSMYDVYTRAWEAKCKSFVGIIGHVFFWNYRPGHVCNNICSSGVNANRNISPLIFASFTPTECLSAKKYTSPKKFSLFFKTQVTFFRTPSGTVRLPTLNYFLAPQVGSMAFLRLARQVAVCSFPKVRHRPGWI